MTNKKTPAEGWPILVGDYAIGEPENPVAVVTLGSHMEAMPVEAGAAISGSLHTENLGIEKVMGNVISNPNLRYLIVCGSEVQGHITGQTIKALHENGVEPEKRKIIGATGAIPYIENIPMDGIERFRSQVEMVDLVDTENRAEITAQIKGCIEKDPGAVEEETVIIKLPENKEKSDLKTENT